jgi:GTP diphosphokinase / guanosine-3',5'-bis(diphosphate) 3'-diphosphatase
MSTLERAIEIAARAHAGQVDKAGQPYLLHPLRLMRAVSTTDERIAAVLHDVVEDTPVTLADLRAEGFPETVLTAIDALTKRDGEARLIAAARAAADPVARNVKLADVTDNMDLGRIANPTEKDFARLREYAQVRALLIESGARLASTPLLRHIVLFKFNPEATPAQIAAIEEGFRALPSAIPLIRAFEWGRDNSPEGLSQGFTHSFVLTFASEADRDAYLPHPAHQAFVATLNGVLAGALVVDYWAKS